MIALGLDGDLGYADLACARVLGLARPTAVSTRTLPALLAGHPHLTPRAWVTTPRATAHAVDCSHAEGHLVPHLGLTSATHARQRPDPLVCIADVSDSVLVRSMTRTEGSSVQYATRTGP